ncbi:hypothetical protein [Candidatus Spongiihabitans sp.]|uniref:hypothetical protein n=1 Tax=Candidatus Spongiihabitans sp. TaxID=3101308 RepID=UPI003C7BD587
MAKIEEVQEDISLMSKLLMASVGTMVIIAGGVSGLILSAETGGVFWVGVVVTIVLFVVFCGLLVRVKSLIRLLGGL